MKAHDIIKTRYIALCNNIGIFADILKEKNIDNNLHHIIKLFHMIMYKDILSNAGMYRDKNDVNNGKIYFGGIKQREFKTKYTGSPTDEIEIKVKEAIQYLVTDIEPPIYNAMRFYQKFVYCHPFYDANGRIARLIVSIYLFYKGKIIDWEPFLDKSHFYKRLNRCHDRMKQPQQYEEYFKYMIDFVSKYVEDKDKYEK